MTLKYLRDLTDDALKGVYKHNSYWQYKWFRLYEDNHSKNIRDKFVNENLERFTKNVNKISKVMSERGIEI